MPELNQTLSNLRDLSAMSRALYHGIKKVQIELHAIDMEIPEQLKRSLHRLDMDLDDLATDLDTLTK